MLDKNRRDTLAITHPIPMSHPKEEQPPKLTQQSNLPHQGGANTVCIWAFKRPRQELGQRPRGWRRWIVCAPSLCQQDNLDTLLLAVEATGNPRDQFPAPFVATTVHSGDTSSQTALSQQYITATPASPLDAGPWRSPAWPLPKGLLHQQSLVNTRLQLASSGNLSSPSARM